MLSINKKGFDGAKPSIYVEIRLFSAFGGLRSVATGTLSTETKDLS